MTDEQINRAIAEACGWTDGVERYVQNLPLMKTVPDYCNDLNAMHEAEKMLDYEQCEVFSDRVADIVQAVNHEMDYPFPWHFARIHATARQRAEAFLWTLEKRKASGMKHHNIHT